MKKLFMTWMVLFGSNALGAQTPILAEPSFLRALKIPIISEEPTSQVAFARISPEMEEKILNNAHVFGKCGGFEALSPLQAQSPEGVFRVLKELQQKNNDYDRAPMKIFQVSHNPQIEVALGQVSEMKLRETVEWLSSYPSRASRGSNANEPVAAFRDRLMQMTAFTAFPVKVELVDHQSTRQKSIHLTIEGKERPSERIIFGAHFDSINQQWGGGNAPGADDNASGSSNLLEALRIILNQPQPQRTLEFFWYAGEENGLLGSAEIAAQYRAQGKDVVAVLQLDMTLYPGEGVFKLGSMTDFTSAWLRDYLRAINDTYVKAVIVEDTCGYGCSDHASWYRNSYPTLMPFEGTLSSINPNIHTSQDIISPKLNFAHSAMFTKIAVIFAMDLGNSTLRQPY